MILSQEQIEMCRKAFAVYDQDRSGSIDVWELRTVFEKIGERPTEESLFQMISEVDDNVNGSIDFSEFLRIFTRQRWPGESTGKNDDGDFVDAFVACGGNPDRSGHVLRDILVRIIKKDFGLTVDIDGLLSRIDNDGNHQISYDEFKLLLSSRN